MEKANLDWSNLGFSCIKTPSRYINYWQDDKWEEGTLIDNSQLTISEGSPTLHYDQQCLKGLKTCQCADGPVSLFRLDGSTGRLQESCARLLMSRVPVGTFISICQEVIKANLAYLPPYRIGGMLYLRPCMIGVSDNTGVAPAKEYVLSIFCVPVGSYFKSGLAPTNFIVSEYDRAADRGTGAARVGDSCIASLSPDAGTHEKEFNDCIYLDPYMHTKVGEVGVANLFSITKDGTFITPRSASVLPSITKYSLLTLARECLGITVLEEDAYIDRLTDFSKAGACDTAAIISPIGGIQNGIDFHVFYSEMEVGPVIKQLYDGLVGIRFSGKEALGG